MTTFHENLQFGKAAESAIANYLRRQGNSILPVYEVLEGNYKGPRLFSLNNDLVAPDMLGFNKNRVYWVEAKNKSVFSWHRKSEKWVTGIDKCHWIDYLKIKEQHNIALWIMFLHMNAIPRQGDIEKGCPHECPIGLFGGEIDALEKVRSHWHPNWGKRGMGMVYWAHENLQKIATADCFIEEVSTRRAAAHA